MVPTLSSAAVQAAVDATPLVQRLDFHFPTYADAQRDDQYLLAGDLLVAPIDPFPPPSPPGPPGPGPAPSKFEMVSAAYQPLPLAGIHFVRRNPDGRCHWPLP